ncbi:hypothetical protein RFI_04639 [Reticulomyxa filosa]|uniref:Uncharacterized protein n=1 Tax=Reticulomyxa filosa TaxID=46433 RepID=X6P4F1_RETFI|nr:hypothetical protein RFI_04639 [Reticulomyxa filosa]|eukprot:ETO32477.1 hypothetical protein RFI_04639 [Reticulomyxa filosa]
MSTSKISERLKSMKFMRRKQDAQEEREEQRQKNDERNALQYKFAEASESLLIVDDQRDNIHMYNTGRRSYCNFNPSVDRLEEESTKLQSKINPNADPSKKKNTTSSTNSTSTNENSDKTEKKRNFAKMKEDEDEDVEQSAQTEGIKKSAKRVKKEISQKKEKLQEPQNNTSADAVEQFLDS